MVKDLKDTLNLPRTRFPMRANLVQREPARIERRHAEKLYQAIQKENANGPLFLLHDGPPFTNGDVHIGTALNKIPKDMITRYKSMRGFRSPYVPGWDCHGLPIEHKVAKELREKGKDLAVADLRRQCAQFSETFIKIQRGQFQRLGVLADWENEYRTMDPAYEAEILRVFCAFVEKGLVYRDKKPVYWSIPCETALAEAEIEYKDHTSPAVWVKFPIPDTSRFNLNAPLSIVIWTTTPWTLPANLAIAVHPRTSYALVRSGKDVFIVAESLVSTFAADVGLKETEILRIVKGEELEGIVSRHPFIDRESPVVTADYVTTSSGTGCVHTAPGHGLEDYMTGQRYKLPAYCPLDDTGRYVDDGQIPADLVGVSVLETKGRSPADEAVLKKLKEADALLQVRKISHSYPHCWRSKTPVIFRAMDQWFVSLDQGGLRERTLAAIEKVSWIPKWGKNRMRGTVESRPDWCISRQRAWGVPIPVFHDEEGNFLLDSEVIRRIAARVEKEGTQFWFEESAEDILREIPLPAGWQGKKLTAGSDTLDVWIDSGSSHLAVLKKRPDLQWPADLYLEGSDQHRGWFQSSLWTAMATEGAPPYKTVLTHGFVVDQDGRKISKSDGKPQTAESYVNQFGADIVRLWVASIDFRSDAPISQEILKHVADTYRSLRNTLRFQISNLFDFDSKTDRVSYDSMDAIDQWALHHTAELVKQTTAAYDNFEFQRVYQLCNQFCAVTLSATYHDLLKDRLYTLAPNAHPRRSSQTAIHDIFNVLVKLLAPILTFTADEAWAYALADEDFVDSSIHLQKWPEPPKEWNNTLRSNEIDSLLEFRGQVYEKLEEARMSKTIGKSLEASIHISAPAASSVSRLLENYRAFLPELFIVSEVQFESVPEDDFTVRVKHADGSRCPRCWRWVPELVSFEDETDMCPRCAKSLN
ncbi:MAG: isoleucine--tRNA ligase [Opitutales bacterium]